MREVADYLDAAPDVENLVESIVFDNYVSEPTNESAPDCEQKQEARIYIGLNRDFFKCTLEDLIND